MIRYFTILAAMLMLAFMASACGKVGAPEPPGPPDQVHYPKSYPTQ